MSDQGFKEKKRKPEEDFSEKIGIKERRKIKARREQERGVWFGLGMFGLVGWSVAIPVLIAIAVGVWLDRKFDDSYSWTLMMIFVGAATGCLNAWYWVKKENERDRD